MYPISVCRNCGIITRLVNSSTPRLNIIRFDMAKLKFLNMLTSMIGASCCHSHTTSETKQTADDDRQRHDEVRAEPVVFLAFVEQDLQRADAPAPAARCRCSRRARRRSLRCAR